MSGDLTGWILALAVSAALWVLLVMLGHALWELGLVKALLACLVACGCGVMTYALARMADGR